MLNNDLCEEKELLNDLLFCEETQIKEKWETSDNYIDQIRRGIYGIVAAINLSTTTDFYFELNENEYEKDIESAIKFLDEKSHRTLYVAYFLDTQYIIKYLIKIF